MSVAFQDRIHPGTLIELWEKKQTQSQSEPKVSIAREETGWDTLECTCPDVQKTKLVRICSQQNLNLKNCRLDHDMLLHLWAGSIGNIRLLCHHHHLYHLKWFESLLILFSRFFVLAGDERWLACLATQHIRPSKIGIWLRRKQKSLVNSTLRDSNSNWLPFSRSSCRRVRTPAPPQKLEFDNNCGLLI